MLKQRYLHNCSSTLSGHFYGGYFNVGDPLEYLCTLQCSLISVTMCSPYTKSTFIATNDMTSFPKYENTMCDMIIAEGSNSFCRFILINQLNKQ